MATANAMGGVHRQGRVSPRDKVTMRRHKVLLTFASALLVAAMTASEARAATITGEVFFTGTGTLMLGAALSNPADADGIDFINPVSIEENISNGDYAGLQAGTQATFTDLMGAAAFGVVGTTGAFVVNPFWTFTDVGGTGLTYTFNLTTVTSNALVGNARVLYGSGIATISGGSYDPTPGVWQLSTSGNQSSISFSSYASVPDGGTTAALLVLAILGIGLVRRNVMS
jgi:hypothetical protein